MPAGDDSVASRIDALETECLDADRTADSARVRRAAEAAIKDARRAGDDALLARAQSWLAYAHLYRGALRECLATAAEADALAQRQGDDLATMRLHSIVGNCEFQLGQHAAALKTLEAGIALAEHYGWRASAAAMRGAVGSALGAMGRFDEGEASFRASIAELEAVGDSRRHLRTLGNLAGLLRRRAEQARADGDETTATAALAEALQVAHGVLEGARASADGVQLPHSLGMLGALYHCVGDLTAAERFLRDGLALGEQLDNQRIVALGALDLARVLRDRAQPDEALAMLAKARTAAQASDLANQLAASWSEEAAVHETRGDHRAALQAYRRFHAVEIDRVAAERVREEQSRSALEEIRRLRREAGALERKAAAAERQARHDPLTDLPNRAGFEADAPPLLERVAAGRQSATMAWIDVDRFKAVNDRFGHAIGDAVLAAVGRILREHVRGGDLAARFGGDEFVVLLEGADRPAALRSIARMHDVMRAHPWERLAPGLAVTLSIGLAELEPGDDLAQLARRADEAMYAAKRGGRNRIGGN